MAYGTAIAVLVISRGLQPPTQEAVRWRSTCVRSRIWPGRGVLVWRITPTGPSLCHPRAPPLRAPLEHLGQAFIRRTQGIACQA